MANPDETNPPKKRIFLNAFDMFTVGHMSFGQWRNPKDRSASKRRDLSYWTDLAQLLEKGDFNALFLADTYGWSDVYKGTAEPCVRTGIQFPMGDPVIPVTAMASVTKNLGFAITSSTSFDSPYVLAKRFSTLDHLTQGRFGWNVVTSWKASGFKAVGAQKFLARHDKRYEIADEFLTVLYKLWEGSWADDALVEDKEKEIYADFDKIRAVHHQGKYFTVDAPHILDPSPQRTPFLFQAGTSPAGIDFGARHAEGIFVVGFTPELIAPRVKAIRDRAAAFGRDPNSLKVFASMTPIIGRTTKEAETKYHEAQQFASEEGGLVYWCGTTHVDLSKFDLDTEITQEHVGASNSRIDSHLAILSHKGDDVPKWTPRNIGKAVALGASGPVPVGTAEEVADEMERWIQVSDIDGFNIGHITTPGTWEDVVELLVPELRKRGIYAPAGESGTMRERFYGQGKTRLQDGHTGTRYKWESYDGQ
ncbi:putative dibenzothiophene desulfurization enzyme A [Dactylonectria macrodidyma]|uniref:Dibenzothiophene desulfurization enzyme A n=1 Tax=Dactylonectria macrodidyma TaxID=307937 RepID=A0A9P9FA04_9HYPO|nr:putative dibenzothiophene desulfurization enzyme A [Dactylonectria macrodidyma]